MSPSSADSRAPTPCQKEGTVEEMGNFWPAARQRLMYPSRPRSQDGPHDGRCLSDTGICKQNDVQRSCHASLAAIILEPALAGWEPLTRHSEPSIGQPLIRRRGRDVFSLVHADVGIARTTAVRLLEVA